MGYTSVMETEKQPNVKSTKASKPPAPPVAKKKPCLVYITCKKCGHRNGPIKPAGLLRSRTSNAIAKNAVSNGKKGGRPRADGTPAGVGGLTSGSLRNKLRKERMKK